MKFELLIGHPGEAIWEGGSLKLELKQETWIPRLRFESHESVDDI